VKARTRQKKFLDVKDGLLDKDRTKEEEKHRSQRT
jgi:hypothetical protein